MGLLPQGISASRVYVGGASASAVYLGGQKVWPAPTIFPVAILTGFLESDVAMPPHEPGDIFIAYCGSVNGVPADPPAAGGTVPDYQLLGTHPNSDVMPALFTATATRNDHTTGAFPFANGDPVAFIALVRGLGSQIAVGNWDIDADTNLLGDDIFCPDINLQNSSGSSLVLHLAFPYTDGTLEANPDDGYTVIPLDIVSRPAWRPSGAAQTPGVFRQVPQFRPIGAIKNDTTSVGSYRIATQSGGSGVWWSAATIEVTRQ